MNRSFVFLFAALAFCAGVIADRYSRYSPQVACAPVAVKVVEPVKKSTPCTMTSPYESASATNTYVCDSGIWKAVVLKGSDYDIPHPTVPDQQAQALIHELESENRICRAMLKEKP